MGMASESAGLDRVKIFAMGSYPATQWPPMTAMISRATPMRLAPFTSPGRMYCM